MTVETGRAFDSRRRTIEVSWIGMESGSAFIEVQRDAQDPLPTIRHLKFGGLY